MNQPNENAWIDSFPGAITVTDETGQIIAMNERAVEMFKSDGGKALIGKNVLDCHPEPARGKLEALFAASQPNAYTVTQNGQTRLIYQTPYWVDGKMAGLVELSVELPFDMPHFDRDHSSTTG